ncbi:MBL fold metallo-hydrolase [Dyadobacter sp. Leaf189]|uniref:MBL fold metallo-hydrolase n=1 Tax=Dyadobacter sp. Leaf189 TaxID=1736295 RepID=UPI0006FFF75E|nr:3',5'-cyclic-nucleotide phosphodiesterase [Dyadobacter sp. Leaf189]KQS23845.1 3',5'-cyclic-nucleotide phosphodiesterase [Dyadobacter sp. Leaf189]
MRTLLSVIITLLCWCAQGYSQNGFRVVPLGVKGGVNDGNLSAYMVAPAGSNAFVCLDAGTLTNGIWSAVQQGTFPVSGEVVLKQYIKGYLISHPHLDHVSGMLLNAVEDTAKHIYGFENCMKVLKTHYFNWESWPNFTNEGAAPAMKKYTYNILSEENEIPLAGTAMHVRAFRLSHGAPTESAAFLVRSGDSYLLYFGDTGPDEVEKSDKIETVWKAVAPLVREGKLRAIFLEVSYPNSQPDKSLFGHLTPKWFFKELQKLAGFTGQKAMQNLNVVVTHIKPVGTNEEKITSELKKENTLGVKLIFPQQGIPLNF